MASPARAWCRSQYTGLLLPDLARCLLQPESSASTDSQSSWRLVSWPLLTRSTLEPLRRGAGVQDTGPQLPAARQLIQAQAAGPLTGWAVAVGTEG